MKTIVSNVAKITDDSMQAIQTTRYIRDNDNIRELQVSLSLPVRSDGAFVSTASASIDGLVQESRDIYGTDTWQSFFSAYRILMTMCDSLMEAYGSELYLDASSAKSMTEPESIDMLFHVDELPI